MQASGENSTLRSAFGDLTPLALRPADGGPLVVCPPRDYDLSAGDRVTLIGRPDDYEAVGRLSRDEMEAEALISLSAGDLDAAGRAESARARAACATGCRRSPPRPIGRCASWRRRARHHRVQHDPAATRLSQSTVSSRRAGMPPIRLAAGALLHLDHRGDGRLRRLQLRAGAGLGHRVRHLPDLCRRGRSRDPLRPRRRTSS